MEAKPEAVIIHDSKEMSQYRNYQDELLRTMKLKKQSKPKFTGGIFNLRLCVFIVVLHLTKHVSEQRVCQQQGRPSSEGLLTPVSPVS